MTLDQLAIKYSTDKSSAIHNYTKIYSRYFDSIRDDVKKVMEIGVYQGSSIRMWEEYFPNSMIYGIDNLESSRAVENNRVRIFIGKQEDTSFLCDVIRDIGGNFDIIIDDGGHMVEQQISSFDYLIDYVKNGGVYIIEDITASYWKGFGGGLKRPNTSIEFLKDRIDDINFSGYTGEHLCLNPDNILKIKPNINKYERQVESIHFYSGLAFVFKR